MVLIKGNKDKFQYLDILKNNLEEFFTMNNLTEPIFQDNDPKHTSKLVQEYLERCNFVTLEWPSQSPDLNPIKHLWAYIKKKLLGFRAKNDQELFAEVERIWYSIKPEVLQNLVLSMKKGF